MPDLGSWSKEEGEQSVIDLVNDFLIIWVMQENVDGFEFRTPAWRVRTRVDNDLLLRECLLTFGASERIHLRQLFWVSRPDEWFSRTI